MIETRCKEVESVDIGIKMKNARKAAQLTQEQVAQELGVSRQTISNWENSKTYPDIVSVVKLSDLYKISLDLLLKEEKPMSSYLDYLDESTNVVKSKRSLGKLILVMTYVVIWAFSLLVFWFFAGASDAMAYSLMFLWILLPVTTFVISLLIGKNNYWGQWKWCAAFVFGVMYMLAEYSTFSMANMDAFDKVNLPRFEMILIGGMISLIGLGIGALLHRVRKKSCLRTEQ
jgi:transcriptional regulator with XRE-family HTH domain